MESRGGGGAQRVEERESSGLQKSPRAVRGGQRT
jgi:hypothetical protein